MKCPNETCEYETDGIDLMIEHIKTHEMSVNKKDFTYEAQFYQNSKGFAQVICTAKGDSIDQTCERLIQLWETVRQKAKENGIEVMQNE